MNKKNNNLLFVTILLLITIFTTSLSHAIPPDPDNAALLYYQGFLSMAQFDSEAREYISDVSRGKIAPDDIIREYIKQCRIAIQFVEAGTKLKNCNWGVRFSQGYDALFPQLSQAKFMTYVLLSEARVFAQDGKYKEALERCLMTEKFAGHMGDDTFISYLVSIAIRGLNYRCMQDVLGKISDDEKLLQWMKNELFISQADSITPLRALKIETDICSDIIQIKNIDKLVQILTDSNDLKTAEIVKQKNEDIISKANEIHLKRMNSMLTIISTDMPYEKAYTQMKQITSEFDPNDPASRIAWNFLPAIENIISLKVRADSHFNAIKTAVEIYLNKIKTGKLPDTIPQGLPKDLFSGKDFKYEKTNDSFILKCQGKDLFKDETFEYAFKVK